MSSMRCDSSFSESSAHHRLCKASGSFSHGFIPSGKTSGRGSHFVTAGSLKYHLKSSDDTQSEHTMSLADPGFQ